MCPEKPSHMFLITPASIQFEIRKVRFPAFGTAAVSSERMFDASNALRQIEGGVCPCSGCGGGLTDPLLSRGGWAFCQNCRCAWQTSVIDGHHYATTIPAG